MKILTDTLLTNYQNRLRFDLHDALQQLTQTFARSKSFNFYTSVAVITSSRIEGEAMEVDSYVKHKTQQVDYLPELTQKPDDLFRAWHLLRTARFLESRTIFDDAA